MPTYRAQIEYDGAAFHGWQTQPNVRTVQGELNRAIGLVARQTVVSAGAGRTDRGVHAKGQVVSFRLERAIDCDRLRRGIEGICRHDVMVRALEAAPETFHARHDALWRRYTYRILDRPSLLWCGRAWDPGSRPSLPLLRGATEPILGLHDFTSFANASPDQVPPECTVVEADWVAWEEGFLFTICADRFLYKMVRNLVGTLIRAASDSRSDAPRVIEAILSARFRREAAAPAPAHGLCFDAVGYDPPWPDADRSDARA